MRACCSRLRPPCLNLRWGGRVVRPESGNARGSMNHGSGTSSRTRETISLLLSVDQHFSPRQ